MREEQGDGDKQGREADREYRRPDEAHLASYDDSNWREPDPTDLIHRVEDGHPVIRVEDLDKKQREMLLAVVSDVSWAVEIKWQGVIVDGEFSELIRDVEDGVDKARYAPHRPALMLPDNWDEVDCDEIPVYERPGVDSPDPTEEPEIAIHPNDLVDTRRMR